MTDKKSLFKFQVPAVGILEYSVKGAHLAEAISNFKKDIHESVKLIESSAEYQDLSEITIYAPDFHEFTEEEIEDASDSLKTSNSA